jgi:hypothetical protein
MRLLENGENAGWPPVDNRTATRRQPVTQILDG